MAGSRSKIAPAAPRMGIPRPAFRILLACPARFAARSRMGLAKPGGFG